MQEQRKQKIEELIRRLASEFIKGETNRTSLITVTRARLAKNLRECTIFVTILPERSEKDALDFLKRERGKFRDYTKKNVEIKYIPRFDFQIDEGEKSRQRLDELSS